ncbi:MAG: hypothetical protein RLZZ563_2594 [Pseudomonadota bacterium]
MAEQGTERVKRMWTIPALLALLILGFAAYVRLAPSDPDLWHVFLPTTATASEDCAAGVVPGRGSATAACLVTLTKEEALQKLDSIAMSTPRTTRLAGSWQQGRITWITRSKLWGFPDYTTAQVQDVDGKTRIDLYGRLRFGSEDMGVNSARLTAWMTAFANNG